MAEINNNNAENRTGKISPSSAVVVIESGFGDEGKGLLTDFHAAPFGRDCIVARFNGGAQAGHTVVLPDGKRHVHSHFGSGTMCGAATYLSRYFVSNPMLFRPEKKELELLEIDTPVVYADESGLVTTPYDMLVNQWVEAARGSGKHGSCGVGFGETIERSLDEHFAIRITDLADAVKLKQILDEIRRQWIPARLDRLKIGKLSERQKDLLNSGKLLDDFIGAAIEFHEFVKISGPDILRTAGGIVFEGAQGLLLDEDYGWFPNVTRSHTGLKNVVSLAAEAGIERLDCVYASRAYATRHGAGYFPHELPEKPFAKIFDRTNIPNPHQDTLRFGWLDLDLLSSKINRDFNLYAKTQNLEIKKNLAVTCLDQLDDAVSYIDQGILQQTNTENFLQRAAEAVGVNEVLASYGLTRQTITKIPI